MSRLAFWTAGDYHLVMKKVGIAELKSRLSEHLRAVRRGRSLVVFDRDTPIARIVPYEAPPGPLAVRGPRPGAPKPGRVPLPPPLRLDVDVVDLLLEERQGER
jgi:prevent-host-death family protein